MYSNNTGSLAEAVFCTQVQFYIWVLAKHEIYKDCPDSLADTLFCT